MKKSTIKTRPWCPFCGQTISRPREPEARKLDEFAVGTCQCGAVYTCDPTGHNIGAAMIEALVYACDDNWDLAWELLPGDDYLTGRIENYDVQTNQVVETRNLDGRLIRGVIYFVRLHADMAELTARLKNRREGLAPGEELAAARPKTPARAIEPERAPKRQRQRADKNLIRELAEADNIDALVDLTFDDIRTLRFLQRLLYDPDEAKRWHTAQVIGEVCARFSTRQPGPVSDLLHRMFGASADSAATNWGLIESMGAIIAGRSDIFGAFTRHLLPYANDPATRVATLWSLGTIARERPDLIRSMPFYQLFSLIEDPDPAVRGHLARLLGHLHAKEMESRVQQLVDDPAPVTLFEEGRPIHTTVGNLASAALEQIQQGERNND